VIGAVGQVATLIGFTAAILGVGASVLALRGRVSVTSAVRLAALAAIAMVSANLVMVSALVVHDFSIRYVAQVGSRSTPLLYTVASLWGALEGSILFWSGLLSAFLLLFAVRARRRSRDDLPAALGVLFAILAFFTFIVLVPGSPWTPVSPVPTDGPGPNPLLANHPLMAIHPPLLYIGFVGLSVPFALTVAALLKGDLGDEWLTATRRWTLLPWASLSAGLILGAWWAYAVLGWGGYWAWDPVENMALVPWLTTTAFLHSAMVTKRRGILRGWNVALVVASFSLTILATLVTRSGVLNSVHAFTQSPIGPLFLVLFGTIAVGSVTLVGLRYPTGARGEPGLGTRATAFLVNNLLFVAIAATVLFGTLFPLLAEALGGRQVSVGAPYFERVIGPLALGLLVLVGIGPALPWGDWSPASRARLIPGAVAAGAAASLLALLDGRPAVVLGGAAGAFAVVESIWLLARRIGALRQSGIRTEGSRHSLGGLTAHIGFGVIGLAVLASSVGRTDISTSVRVGESVQLGDVHLFLDRVDRAPDAAGRDSVVAQTRLQDGQTMTAIAPALTVFPTSNAAIATPAVMPGAIADLYVTLTNVDPSAETVTLRLARYPFVSWLWVGGAILAAGGVIAGWPAKRRTSSSVSVRSSEAVRPATEGAS